MSNWFIYALIDPRVTTGRACDEVRYIGFSVNTEDRLATHIYKASQGSRYHVHCWIRQLLSQGLSPVLRVVDYGVGEDTWQATEIYWIQFYRHEVGADLTNMTAGGDGMFGCSADTRRKIGEKSKGRISHEQAVMYGKAHLGKKRSEETKRNISTGNIGKHSVRQPGVARANEDRAWSEETRKKSSESCKRSWTPEKKRERSNAMKLYWKQRKESQVCR